jgi:3-hydroxymyristoyl/3-hydroxydecanoyl-(acyl carrier protein) dehydratase
MRFLFVDRIVDSEPRQFIRGLKHVTADDFYLTQDNAGRACFIPALVGETLGQLAAWNVMAAYDFALRPVAGVVASVTFHREVYVGETVLLEAHIDRLDESAVEYHGVACVGNTPVLTLEGALGPMLPMADFIAIDEIKRQYAEINRPGDWTQLTTSLTNAISKVDRQRESLFFGFDAIVSHEPGVSLVAEKHVTRAAPYFPDHFSYKPVLPLTILIACKQTLAAQFIQAAGFQSAYRLVGCARVKMNGFVSPGDVLRTQVTIKQQDETKLCLAFRTELDGRRVCVLEMWFEKG